MIIRGGENIYPREIEEYLHKHPHIADVSVVGVPDHKYGELTCACVIKKAGGDAITTEEVKAFCKGKLSHYKVPDHVFFVEGFPLTITGKVQKYILRDECAHKLGILKAKL